MSAREIEILHAGPLATVQDAGRRGTRAWGVALGGALDRTALAVANVLAGNEPDAAAIEATYGGLSLRLECDALVALAGAQCDAEIDGARAYSWGAYPARAGSVLSLGVARAGVRSYVAFGGGIGVEEVLGSRSTDLAAGFGGFHGRALRPGDRLALGAPHDEPARRVRVKPPFWENAGSASGRTATVRFLPGGAYDRLEPRQRARLESPWRVASESNRMACRLRGEPVELVCEQQLSHAVFPGVIQLPPAGEPIVLLADAQVTGGYPHLGAAIEADLGALAQIPAGGELRLEPCSLERAAQARRELATYLEEIAHALRSQR